MLMSPALPSPASAGISLILLAAFLPSPVAAQPLSSSIGPGSVVINEILYDPPDAALEFVEVMNLTDQPVDLCALRLADARMQPSPVCSGHRDLAPGALAVLARDTVALVAAFPGTHALQPRPWPVLNDGGDAVVLLSGSTPVDSVYYQTAWGGYNVSLERRDPTRPTLDPRNWGPAKVPVVATPGLPNSLYNPDRRPPELVFAEQPDPAHLSRFFDEPVDPASAALTLDGRPADAFSLLADSVLSVGFATPVTAGSVLIERIADIGGNALVAASPAVAWLASPADVVVNEILFAPRADRFDLHPDQPEYFELFNRTGHALSLRAWFWTDAPDETGAADTLRPAAGFVALPPGGYALVYAAGADATSGEAALRAAFPGSSFEGVPLLPLRRSSLSLVNTGGLVRLHRANGTTIDTAPYQPEWHSPFLSDATGIALERIDPDGPPADPSNWSSSADPDGGTPGRANSLRLPPREAQETPGLQIVPSPFSPDGDGRDDVAALRYSLRWPSSAVRVRIYDARGRQVRALAPAQLAGPTGQVLWDGLDDDGRVLPVGIYVVLLEATADDSDHSAAFKEVVVLARPL